MLPEKIREALRSRGLLEFDEKVVLQPAPNAPAQVYCAPAPAPSPTTAPPESADDDWRAALLDCTEPGDYVTPAWADYALRYFMRSDQVAGLMLEGPRGTGKTLLAEVMAARCGAKMLKVECDGDMTPEALIGCPRIRAGTDYWQAGPLYLAAKASAAGVKIILFLDEANAMPPSAQIKLNALLDRMAAGFFVRYTGEHVRWDRPKIVMAFNGGYRGTHAIQPALRDRCWTCIATYLDEASETGLIAGRTGIRADWADNMVKCASAIRAAAKGDSGTMPLAYDLSPRPLLQAAEAVQLGMPVTTAWREAVINRAGSTFDAEPIRAVLEELSRSCGMMN